MTTFLKTNKKPVGSILCVDDDDDDATLFESAVLTINKGINFLKCYGGREALDLLTGSDSTPDIILLDVNMPLLNGFECLREIRKHKALMHIPVIMLSTSASPIDVSTALKLGATKFLTKPNSYVQICKMMNEVIAECLTKK
jgi:CheY-like chemotaxis protein